LRIGLVSLILSIFSCKKSEDGPKASDNILNYEITEIPVTTDYVVGAFYAGLGTFNPSVTETPVAGKYNMPGGVVDPAVMTQHITAAGKGGINYFVFDFRSANRDVTNYRFDSAVVKSFLDANTTANMKFALQYNWSTGSFGVNNTTPLEGDAVKLEQFFRDIEKVAPLFANSNYMKVNGKILLYIKNAQVIFSNNTAAIYTTLRSRLTALGFPLYIVGMQEPWSPPARYPFRFQGCVDAVYFQSLSGVGLTSWDRFYLLPQAMDQNFKYAKNYFSTTFSLDFVPNISPAYNPKILSPVSTNPVYARTDAGALYKQLCNVAKMNASSTTRLILIDSFNDWQNDTELEPAVSFGEAYLQITKAEFKK